MVVGGVVGYPGEGTGSPHTSPDGGGTGARSHARTLAWPKVSDAWG